MLEDDTVYPNKPVCEFSRGYQENAQYADGVLWQKDHKKSMVAYPTEKLPLHAKIQEQEPADPQLMNVMFKLETEEKVNSSVDVSEIGQGSFGLIYLCKDKQTGASVVVKLAKNPEAREDLATEERNLQQLKHENLIRSLGFHTVKYFSDKCLIMETANQSLSTFWRKSNSSRPMENRGERMMAHALGMCRGLRYLQEQGRVHCDIKPENVCVLSNGLDPSVIKIIDMASCRRETDPPPKSGITHFYLPPSWNLQFYFYRYFKNLSECPRIGHKDDIWAAGLVIVYMVHGVHVIVNMVKQMYGDMPNMKLQLYELGQLQKLPDEFYSCDDSPVLKALLTKLLTVDESQRWTAREVCGFLEEKRDQDMDLHSKKKQTVSDDIASLSERGDYKGVEIDRKKRKCPDPGAGEMVSKAYMGDNFKLRRNNTSDGSVALLDNCQQNEGHPNVAGCSGLLNVVQQDQKHSQEKISRPVWIDGEQYVNQISTDSFPE